MTSQDLELAKYHQEWWKIVVSAFTPIAIAALTYFITSSLNVKESELKKSEEILSEKQKTYSKIGEDINIVYVYAADVGDFRNYTPDQIISRKRDADRTFFMYRPYWSNETQRKYDAFMKAAFEMYIGPGLDAKIKTSSAEKKAAYSAYNKQWNPAWDKMFAGEADPALTQIYYAVVSCFLNDIASAAVNSSDSCNNK
jgi:hypothetical protein